MKGLESHSSVQTALENVLDSRFKLIRCLDKKSTGGSIIGSFTDGLALYRDSYYKYGFIDPYGEIRIQRIYKDATPFSNGIACVQDDKGFFLINTDGERITTEYFEEECLPCNDIICYKHHGLYGYRKLDGTIIAEPRYKRAHAFHSGLAAVEVEGKTGFIDIAGDMVIPPQYDTLIFVAFGNYLFQEGLAAVALNGRFGYINNENEFIIPPQYSSASIFKDGIATVTTDEGKTAINSNGEPLFSPIKADIGRFFNGCAGFEATRYIEFEGVIRKDGTIMRCNDDFDYSQTIRQSRYKNRDFSRGLIPFSRNGLWGFMNVNGCEVIEPIYDDVEGFDYCDYTSVKKDELWGLIDAQGNIIIDCLFPYAIDYDGGDRLIVEDLNFTYLYEVDIVSHGHDNHTAAESSRPTLTSIESAIAGVMEIKAQYELTSNEDVLLWKNKSSEGMTGYCQNGMFGFYDGNGTSVIKPKFKRIRSFSSGIGCVSTFSQGGQWFYIDRSGNRLFDIESEDGLDASDERILIRRNGKTGYMDVHGNMVIPPTFILGNEFADGLAAVEVDNRWGFIDRNGNMAIAPQFASETLFEGSKYRFSEGLAAIKINGRYGYINRKGEVVIEPRFQKAQSFSDGYAAVATKNGATFIDKNGLPTFSPLPDIDPLSSWVRAKGNVLVFDTFMSVATERIVNMHGKNIQEGLSGIDYREVNYSAGVIPFIINNKWGLMDIDGGTIVSPQFDYIYCTEYGYSPKTGDYLILFREKGKKGIMNQRGEVLIDPVLEELCDFNEAGLLNVISGSNRKALILKDD